jgi:hypothetical protein
MPGSVAVRQKLTFRWRASAHRPTLGPDNEPLMSRATIIVPLIAVLAFALGAEVAPSGVPASSSPLPTVDSVLDRIVARAAADREQASAFDASYRYKRAKKTVTKDGDGDIQKSVVIEFENDPSAGRTAEDPAEAQPKSKRPYNQRDFVLDRALLDRYVFTLEAREIRSGRPTLVMNFRPADKRLPSKDLKDRFLNRTSGRVWVDEEDAVVSRLETRLLTDITFLGGLVANVSRCELQFQRERTPEGWWWVESAEWHVEARKFFSRISVDYQERATEVEKVR